MQLHSTIRTLITEARNAAPYRARHISGIDEPRYIPTPAARSTMIDLGTQTLSGLFDKQGKLVRTPTATLAAASVRMDAGIALGSRVASAGAHVLVYPESTRAVPAGKDSSVIALERKPSFFRVIEAATFATVADGGEVALSAVPVSVAAIDWGGAAQRSVRFNLPRVDLHNTDPELLAAEILAAITLGIGRAADEALLSAITATPPAPYSIASVAAQGLKLGELRGVIGTAGTGAEIGADGSLRVAGVSAELSPAIAQTVIGAFDRAMVAIHQDLPVHFMRTNLAGDLEIIAWVTMLPLVPDLSKFWIAA